MQARRSVALALALWLAGTGCLLGCERGAAAAHAAASQHAAAHTDSCHAFAAHGCCHRAAPDATRVTPQAEETFQTESHGPASRTVCPLAGQTADAARKVRHADAAAVAVSAAAPHAPDAQALAPRAARRWRVPARGGTHLRCCVLLI
ncbi:MAG TPA: hypothetical protein VF546_09130 [Pyrinomonadaceae bacterium]|jgi:hypothetical protein